VDKYLIKNNTLKKALSENNKWGYNALASGVKIRSSEAKIKRATLA
jgi:hypothetical protein